MPAFMSGTRDEETSSGMIQLAWKELVLKVQRHILFPYKQFPKSHGDMSNNSIFNFSAKGDRKLIKNMKR